MTEEYHIYIVDITGQSWSLPRTNEKILKVKQLWRFSFVYLALQTHEVSPTCFCMNSNSKVAYRDSGYRV